LTISEASHSGFDACIPSGNYPPRSISSLSALDCLSTYPCLFTLHIQHKNILLLVYVLLPSTHLVCVRTGSAG